MEQNSSHSLQEITNFISEYAAILMGSGVHTSRVSRNTRRLAEALGVQISISTFPKTLILDVTDDESSVNKVVDIPALPISFEYNAELSKLSWEALDDSLPLDEIRARFDRIVARPRLNKWLLLLLVGAANASFCRLFGGDWISMGVVFVATVLGFLVRVQMLKRHINHYIVFMVAAFVASLAATLAFLLPTATANVAISTSVLFLIPGVPLINGVIDILEGFILTGMTRLINAGLLTICITIGLAMTLWIVKSSLI